MEGSYTVLARFTQRLPSRATTLRLNLSHHAAEEKRTSSCIAWSHLELRGSK